MKWLEKFLNALEITELASTILHISLFCFAVLCTSWIAHFLTKLIFVRGIRALITKTHQSFGKILIRHHVIRKLAYIIPITVVYISAPLFDFIFNGSSKDFKNIIIHVLQTGSLVCMIMILFLSFNALLETIHTFYTQYEVSKKKPISTYLEVLKIVGFIFATIISISIILDKSPVVFFTGLGAAMALIILVFKDMILGLITSIQLTSYDLVRIGDWITMPKFRADGDVIEISLTTVKVQNFDKTISTIPTYALLDNTMQNWRGMKESGGRRIKRSINIDMNTIQFCDKTDLEAFEKIFLLKNYLQQKKEEINHYNEKHPGEGIPLNIRKLSNIGIFRQYVIEYLTQNPHIHKKPSYTFLVRQLEPTETGLPLQIYVFTNNTNWIVYEKIQSDIFDHLLAALPMFGLKAFQNTSGQELFVHLNTQMPA